MLARFACALSLLLMPVFASAQPLADKVPADSLVYIGWQGVDSMPAAYQQSHLKAILDQSNIPALVNDFLPRLLEKIGQEEPGAAVHISILSQLAKPMWKHPTAFYILPPDWAGGAGPVPKGAIICQAGDEADAMLQQLTAIADQAKQAPFPIKAFKQDGVVGIEVGFAEPAAAMAGAGGSPPITGSASFKAAIAQVNKEPVGILYVDTEGLVGQIDQFVNMVPDPQAKQVWPVIRDALGVKGLKRIVCTCGFDGQDWSSQAFIAAPAPRAGILSMIDNKPLTNDLLQTIPKSATLMSAGRFDLAKLVANIRDIAGKIDPNVQQGMDMALTQIQNMIGLDVQKDILQPLGDQWAIYLDPNSNGNGLLGFVIVNRLNKPAEAEQSLTKLSAFIDGMIKQNAPPKITIRFDTVKSGNTDIHFVSLPVVAPSWAVKDGTLFVGLYPQVVSAALDNGGAGKSILDNPDFLAVRKKLGAQNACGISFYDLPRSQGGGYQLCLALTQLGLGAADMFGVKSPQPLLPPLGKIREHLTPAGSAVWVDDEGLHMKAITPFPGAELIASPAGGLSAGSAALAAGVMMPALARARMQAQRAQGMSNLKQIGIGLMMYASDNRGNLPPDLGALIAGKYFGPNSPNMLRVFVTPFRANTIPAGVMAAELEEKAKWINEHSDYVYVLAGMKLSRVRQASTAIMAYEKPEVVRNGRMNVLFADAHVESMDPQQAMAMVEQQKQEREK